MNIQIKEMQESFWMHKLMTHQTYGFDSELTYFGIQL